MTRDGKKTVSALRKKTLKKDVIRDAAEKLCAVEASSNRGPEQNLVLLLSVRTGGGCARAAGLRFRRVGGVRDDDDDDDADDQ